MLLDVWIKAEPVIYFHPTPWGPTLIHDELNLQSTRVWKFLLTRRVQRRASAGDKIRELKQASNSFLQIAGHIPASAPHGHPSGFYREATKGCEWEGLRKLIPFLPDMRANSTHVLLFFTRMISKGSELQQYLIYDSFGSNHRPLLGSQPVKNVEKDILAALFSLH